MQQFDFIVRCWFPQVSNNKMYNEVYQRWREVLQVEPLFEEVKREIDELDEYWERERLNLEARLLNFITWFFFPFAFLFSLWGMNFLEIVQPPMSFKNSKVLLFSGAVVAVYFLILLLFRLLRGGRK